MEGGPLENYSINQQQQQQHLKKSNNHNEGKENKNTTTNFRGNTVCLELNQIHSNVHEGRKKTIMVENERTIAEVNHGKVRNKMSSVRKLVLSLHQSIVSFNILYGISSAH
ncbi:unnamed protein product [Rotaria sordida]|uniref:Uncharacterized protein n=1 Tax=Rotaria sordida TaxID=392033 RepID=A0A816B091_9BILA|nr:unnamed protein product [Rotaria sordida]CAF1604376.1 unnamed protein product [Rotaria sordida]